MVKAGDLPPEAKHVGWIWIVDWISDALEGVSKEHLPKVLQFHRGWRRTRMEDRPITCRGVIAEAMKHGEQDATLLQSDTKMEKLLGQREAIENGDIANIAKETGIELTHTQLVAVLKRIMAMVAAVPANAAWKRKSTVGTRPASLMVSAVTAGSKKNPAKYSQPSIAASPYIKE